MTQRDNTTNEDRDLKALFDELRREEELGVPPFRRLPQPRESAPGYWRFAIAASMAGLLLVGAVSAGLLLWMPTGGAYAASFLAEQYYGQYARLAEESGLAAVWKTPHYQERIAQNPGNETHLKSLDVESFVAVMKLWSDYFLEGAELPVIGASAEKLRTINIPVCIVPGSDPVHPRQVALDLADLLPHAELHYPFEKEEREFLKSQPVETITTAYQSKLRDIFSRFLTSHYAS